MNRVGALGAEIYEALVTGRMQAHIGFARRGPEDEERSLELAVGLFERLRKSKLPAPRAAGGGLRTRWAWPPQIAPRGGALLEFGADLPSEFDETLAKAVAHGGSRAGGPPPRRPRRGATCRHCSRRRIEARLNAMTTAHASTAIGLRRGR